MNFHPLANIFPLLEGQPFADLVADVSAHGVREAVWLHEGQILDGRNRWRAANEAGAACPTRAYEGTEPAAFVVSLNLHRRHLDESQRAMVAAKLANLPDGVRADASIGAPAVTQSEAADMLNVSRRAVQRARAVIQDGAPELVAAVERGDVAVSAASQIVSLPKEVQADIVATGPEEVREVAKQARVHVANNSGNNEWYTPARYIDAARKTMGGIDTDPASSDFANKTVKAKTFYTSEDDGRAQKWAGKVWMNPPYAQPLIGEFCDAVAAKYEAGEIEQACVLVNNATETQWFQRLLGSAHAVCFVKGRIKYLDATGTPANSPLQGQAVLYFGKRDASFKAAFADEGQVLFRA